MEASKDSIRISKIAGRYLVFDVKDVTRLRRDHDICAILVGVTPQATAQNIFSGLPLELAPEEAKVLIDRGLAFAEDDVAAHITQLSQLDADARNHYIKSLLHQRNILQSRAVEELTERRKHSEELRRKHAGIPSKRRPVSKKSDTLEISDSTLPNDLEDTSSLCSEKAAAPSTPPAAKTIHLTPSTTSASLLTVGSHLKGPDADPARAAVVAHFNSRGFYMTPGLRFGCDFSVYPGDPFRYHAHFMAKCYGWDERIDVLDLVTGGRLATRVKKGYVIAADKPRDGLAGGGELGDQVRAFTIEWAAI
jgi:tRNA-splicing endonuclease subunit Sen34